MVPCFTLMWSKYIPFWDINSSKIIPFGAYIFLIAIKAGTFCPSPPGPKHIKTQFLYQGDFRPIFYGSNLDALNFKIKLVLFERLFKFSYSLFRCPYLATREKILSSDHCVTDRTPHFSVQHEWAEEQYISISFYSKQGTDAGRLP